MAYMGIHFTVVFLCENVQPALMVSPRIATGASAVLLLQLMFFACIIIITSPVNHLPTTGQGQIPAATVFLSNEQ